ncbi:hypothetical protein DN752_03135 [Echinicola strongylocentroti]|uniref:RNA polymerase sigma-70 factor n=1 Tax=Echinicola strongylocentroti TaxID=1795355 RepID=A0A2Z4IE80_9BACT|nr:RNA polymerase sigma-70 factor [Echinicola strongylocentroti]AWW29214.1 hypothetical protein DN752_03135 [Echinicola strongylocentroti]
MFCLSNNREDFFLAVADGDEEAFSILFEMYHTRIYHFAKTYLKDKALSEDLVQEIFIKIWQEKGKLKEIDNFDSYLFTMVKRKSIDVLRKVARDKKLAETIKMNLIPTSNPHMEDDNTGYLSKIKENLSAQQRLVFDMSRNQGLTYEDIAYKLNISKNTVRNHMVEALKVLKKALKRNLYLF